MEMLAQEGKIMEKVYGKQKIYFADQVSENRFTGAYLFNKLGQYHWKCLYN